MVTVPFLTFIMELIGGLIIALIMLVAFLTRLVSRGSQGDEHLIKSSAECRKILGRSKTHSGRVAAICNSFFKVFCNQLEENGSSVNEVGMNIKRNSKGKSQRTITNKISSEKSVKDPPSVDKQKLVSKKPSKKSSNKKKKHRGSPWLLDALKECKNMDCQIEGQTKGDPSEELERRGKGRRNRSSLPRPPVETSNQQKIAKVHTPSTLFTEMKMEPLELYYRLQRYLLSLEELKVNGFPLDTPENPGKVHFGYDSLYDCFDLTKRSCSRCGEVYHVTDVGDYVAENHCIYHPGKRLALRGIVGAGAYSCCNQSSKGCATSLRHVSSPLPVGEVEFVKTRYKKLPPYCVPYKVYSLDCEMCYTLKGLEVTKVTVVNADGIAVYDTFVLPENPIIDYNTTYSGVTANDLKDVTITLADVQAFLLKLLHSRTILIGHGLDNDLRALRLIHETVVDTSVVFPHHFGPPRKRSLKSLAVTYLQKNIQESEAGHDSVEDARTCIELMLWKIQSDKENSQLLGLYPSTVSTVPKAPPRLVMPSSPMCANHLFVPNQIGYFVPPVGSHY